MEGKLSPVEVVNQVMKEGDSFIQTKLLTSAQNTIDQINGSVPMEANNIIIDVTNIPGSIINIKSSDIAERKQASIIEQIDLLKTTYGADIFTRLANQ